MFTFIIEGVLLSAVSILGVVGNVVAIFILSKPVMKGSFTSLLIGLSIFDMLYLIIGISIFGLPEMSQWYKERVYIYIMPFGYGLGHIGRVGSVFVTVSVTIERYFAICHPLKHLRGKKYLLLIPSLMAILYNIPKFMEFELRYKLDDKGLENVTVLQTTQLRSNAMYATFYVFWSKFILVEVIPYCTIVVLNSLIIAKIWKSIQFRKKLTTTNNGHDIPDVENNQGQPTSPVNAADVDVPSNGILALAETLESPKNLNSKRNVKFKKRDELTDRQQREANLGTILVCISLLFILCQSIKIIPDAYEVVNCRLNNKHDVNNREIKLPLPYMTILNLSRAHRNRNSTNYSAHSHEVNENNFNDINEQSRIIELLKCAETTNTTLSSCLNQTSIQKVTFEHRKEDNNNEECLNTPTINKLIVMSHLLLAINSSANVIIYMLKGENFKEALRATFHNLPSAQPSFRRNQTSYRRNDNTRATIKKDNNKQKIRDLELQRAPTLQDQQIVLEVEWD